MSLLLIEDEIKTLQTLKQGLEENGFTVDTAPDGKTGLSKALVNPYEIIVTDIVLPFLSGHEFCKTIRKAGIETPILMLTALSSTDDVVFGFESGADDYLVKPFAFKELLARIRALSKRAQPQNIDENILREGNLILNLQSKSVLRAGHSIELTPKEFALLEFFMRNKNKVLSRKELAKEVWQMDFDTGTNMVEVYVNYLRKKIDKDFEPKLIHTQFGHGYILKAQ
jgi:two-component system, OmpR family, copper resistance phosphate regulon response regulator CusR